jgi:hypothetical protein
MCAIYLSTFMLSITIIDHSLDIRTHLDPLSRRSLPHHRPTKRFTFSRGRTSCVGPPVSSEASYSSFLSGLPSACSWRCSGFSIFLRAYAFDFLHLRPALPSLFCRSHLSNYDTSTLYVTAPHNFLLTPRACHTTATPSSFWDSRFTCHRCMHFPARLYNKVISRF